MMMNLVLMDLLIGVVIFLDFFLSLVFFEYLCWFLMYLYCIGVVVFFMIIMGLLVDCFVVIFYFEKKFFFVVVIFLWVVGVFLLVVNFIDGFKIYGLVWMVVCVFYIMMGRVGLVMVIMVFCFLFVLNVFFYMLMFMKIFKFFKVVYFSDNLRSCYFYRI